MALHSDSALQRLKIRKQESSLQKIHKYEQIADKLINNESDGRGGIFLITFLSKKGMKIYIFRFSKTAITTRI